MYRWLIVLLALFCLLTLLTPSDPAHAASIPSRTITIHQNSIGHMYFAPTYPACVTGGSVQIKLINSTRHTAHLLLDVGETGKSLVVNPSKTLTMTIKFQPSTYSGFYGIQIYILERFDAEAFVVQC